MLQKRMLQWKTIGKKQFFSKIKLVVFGVGLDCEGLLVDSNAFSPSEVVVRCCTAGNCKK